MGVTQLIVCCQISTVVYCLYSYLAKTMTVVYFEANACGTEADLHHIFQLA